VNEVLRLGFVEVASVLMGNEPAADSLDDDGAWLESRRLRFPGAAVVPLSRGRHLRSRAGAGWPALPRSLARPPLSHRAKRKEREVSKSTGEPLCRLADAVARAASGAFALA
jgi:hypothetical protein